MNGAANELIDICEHLPADKQATLTHFARFLLAESDDAHWEAILNNPAPRPRLDAFLEASARQPAEPLNPDQL